MKSIILVALAVVAVAAAAPAEEVKTVAILRSTYDPQPEGGYVFSFESDDGNQREEVGTVKEVLDEENKPHKVVVVRGSYSYINKEGKVVSVTYVADEGGFKAEGDSIPKPDRQ